MTSFYLAIVLTFNNLKLLYESSTGCVLYSQWRNLFIDDFQRSIFIQTVISCYTFSTKFKPRKVSFDFVPFTQILEKKVWSTFDLNVQEVSFKICEHCFTYFNIKYSYKSK